VVRTTLAVPSRARPVNSKAASVSGGKNLPVLEMRNASLDSGPH
jgi:hypothetical protein